MSRLDEFYSTRPEMRPQEPVKAIHEGIGRYMQEQQRPHLPISNPEFRTVSVHEPRGRAIGEMYQNLPAFDPKAVPSFQAMEEETKKQFDFLTRSPKRGGLGVDVEATSEDPYGSPSEMRADLERGRMKVLSTQTTGSHPFFSDDTNDMFRAVHDVFGHAGSGRGFDRHGEEAAWMKHSQMYPSAARPAMTSETRGQNSAFIYSLGGNKFPEQKVALLPSPYTDLTRTTAVGRRAARRSPLNTQQFRTI